MTWTTTPLRRLFEVVNGGTPRSDDLYWGGSVPWATPVDLAAADGAAIGADTARTLTAVGLATGSRSVPAGSVVLSTRAPIGYVAEAETDLAFNQGCRGLVPRDRDTCIRFFVHQLWAQREQLQMSGNGTTFQELGADDLASFRVSVPPTEVQRRIAAFLDAETERVDQLVATKSRMINVLAERQQAVIDDAFGCRSISRRWDGVPVSPREGCSTARLGALASINGGVTVDSSRVVEDEVEVSYLRVANVQDGSLDLSEVKTILLERRAVDRFLLRPGDVLMTEGGDPDKLGRGAVWQGEIQPCVTQNHVFFVRPDPNVLSSDYLSLLSQTSYARAYFETTASKTTGIASTSSSKIAAFKVPVPSRPSQDEIVKTARCSLAAIDRAASTIRAQLSLLHERRRSLVAAAVKGEMEVP